MDNWQVGTPAPGAVEALRQAGIPALLGHILAARGYDTPARAEAFLRSARAPLPDPLLLKDMAAARDRVRLALQRGERICVFGDYDVDGITATCLLVEYLQAQGGQVRYYIPGRLDEGYGLSVAALEQLQRDGVQLVVTVDCGITAVAEAEACRQLGMELVITDHHTCGPTLPDAVAVVDPHRPDDDAPFGPLAGVGVAFALAAALAWDTDPGAEQLLSRYSELLALGTVADVMPLTGVNRAMVARGVAALRTHPRVGLRALLAHSGATNVNTTTIGYTLAPRINAAGRMGQAELAVQLLLTRDEAEADAVAEALCALNRERQRVEQTIYAAARRELAGQRPPAVVLASPQWHQGVVGIVASRLSEEYGCPVCLICLDGETGKASCRSYGGFALMDALHQLAPLLERYGGHQLAAGFTIRAEQIDSFREALIRLCRDHVAPARPALTLDCRIDDPSLLSLDEVAALEALEPCGAECPRPQIASGGWQVVQLSEVGGGKHLRLRLQKAGVTLQGIYFSMTALRAGVAPGDVVEVAGVPQINEFRSQRTVQLQLTGLRPMEDERRALAAELQLYQRHCSGQTLTAPEAASLIPPRAEFAAVWRYLKANSQGGVLREQADCLSRKIARSAGLPVSFMRTRVCLDVLRECGLLALTQRQEQVEIHLRLTGPRVDLDASTILQALRRRSGEGE